MKILRRGAKQAEPDEIDAESADDALVGAEPAEEPGPHLLSDGPLLARWYILYELEK
jgi:hypothetical protein